MKGALRVWMIQIPCSLAVISRVESFEKYV